MIMRAYSSAAARVVPDAPAKRKTGSRKSRKNAITTAELASAKLTAVAAVFCARGMLPAPKSLEIYEAAPLLNVSPIPRIICIIGNTMLTAANVLFPSPDTKYASAAL